MEFGEVQYFFCARLGENTFPLAMVSRYTPPDQEILKKSHGVVYLCSYTGKEDLVVISAKQILSVVAMIPLDHENPEKVFLVEKPGLDVAILGSKDEALQEEREEE